MANLPKSSEGGPGHRRTSSSSSCEVRVYRHHSPGCGSSVFKCFVLIGLVLGLHTTEISGEEAKVQGLVGESVDLPCGVDEKNCGSVYFITWTKQVGNQWKRIYLYSDTVEKPLQELANPDRAKFSLNKTAASLTITNLMLEDEGAYKCDVTYIRGKCPSLSFAKLTTLAKPSTPVIESNDRALGTGGTVGPVQEGDNMTLTCKTYGGKPVPKVTWFKGFDKLPSTSKETNTDRGSGDVSSMYTATLRRSDLGSNFTCQVLNDAIKEPIRTWVQVDLHVRPQTLEIEPPELPAVAGTAIPIRCVVDGAKPPADITWYNRTERLKYQPHSTVEPLPDGTFRTVSVLEVVVSRHDHQGSFFCKGSNPVILSKGEPPLERHLDIQVLYPPEVNIKQSNGEIVKEGERIVLHCSYNANPINIKDIVWSKDNMTLDVESDNRYERSNPGVPALTIKDLTKRDKGHYACALRNEIGWGNSTNLADVDVLYSPTVVARVSPAVLKEGLGTRVTLACEVEDGNPSFLRRVRWYRDGEQLNETSEKTIVWMDVLRNFTGNYSCQGENNAGWGAVSESQELIVNYPPGTAVVIHRDDPAVKGRPTTFDCIVEDPGRPVANYFRWSFESDRGIVHQLDESSPTFTLDHVELASRGVYTCAAVNEVGVGGSGNYSLRVTAAPAFIEPLPTSYGALQNDSSISLVCRVECDPQCSIEWLRAAEVIDSSRFYTVHTTPHREEPDKGLFASVVSTLRFNMSHWPDGLLDRVQDNTTYTCRSSANIVGESVASTTRFEVEYPPESIVISTSHLLVMEGDFPEQITCSASSWPPSDYMWKYKDNIISSNPVLEMNYEFRRERSGNYTCVASNRHGSINQDTFIDVIYPPSCSMYTSRNAEGNVIVICEVDARPSQVNITWMRGNETLEDNVDTEGVKSIYTVPEDTVEYYGRYMCMPNNTLGEGFCEYSINGPGGAYNQIYLDDEQVMMITGITGVIVLVFIIIIIILVLIMKRRRRRDLSSPAKAKAAVGNEPLYQNVEGKTENGPGQHLGNNDVENRATYENMPFHPQRNPKGPYRPDISDDILYADLYDDVKMGRVADPRLIKPPLPPKAGAAREPPIPPKTRKPGLITNNNSVLGTEV